MATVFDYNITIQEMIVLNIQSKESYVTTTDTKKAFRDLCDLLNLRNDGKMIVKLLLLASKNCCSYE